MLWFDPSLQVHAAGDSWESVFDRTSQHHHHDAFAPPRSKRALEYAAHYHYAFSSFDPHKYTRYEPLHHRTPQRRHHHRRVRFSSSDDDQEHSQTPFVAIMEIPNRLTLTPEQKNAMWYNGHDIRSFFRDARKVQDQVRAQTGCRCLQIRKCPTCRPVWRAMD